MQYNYNTQRKRMSLPEYGRSVQNMVDHALSLTDRAERQRCANAIVNIMGNMFPQLRDVPDFKHKLWDHLAIMADFKLDIDYPYEIVKPDTLDVKPDRIPYSTAPIRYRHYGRAVELLIKQAVEMPEGDERTQLLRMVAVQMKKDYITWNKDGVEDQKILDDISELSEGRIRPDESLLRPRQQPYQQSASNNNNHRYNQRQRYNNNNQKRKY